MSCHGFLIPHSVLLTCICLIVYRNIALKKKTCGQCFRCEQHVPIWISLCVCYGSVGITFTLSPSGFLSLFHSMGMCESVCVWYLIFFCLFTLGVLSPWTTKCVYVCEKEKESSLILRLLLYSVMVSAWLWLLRPYRFLKLYIYFVNVWFPTVLRLFSFFLSLPQTDIVL